MGTGGEAEGEGQAFGGVVRRLEVRAFARKLVIVENEKAARAANEDRRSEAGDAGLLEIGCECGDSGCHGRVHVPVELYEATRERKDRFLVLPGHEVPDVERVVERLDEANVVEKIDKIGL